MFRCAITQNWKTSLAQDSLLLQQKVLWVGYTIVDTFSINTLIVQYETLGNSTVQSENVFEKQIIQFLTFHLQLFHQVVGYWPEWRHTLLHLCVGYDEVLLPGYTHQYFLVQNWDEGVLEKKPGSHHCAVGHHAMIWKLFKVFSFPHSHHFLEPSAKTYLKQSSMYIVKGPDRVVCGKEVQKAGLIRIWIYPPVTEHKAFPSEFRAGGQFVIPRRQTELYCWCCFQLVQVVQVLECVPVHVLTFSFSLLWKGSLRQSWLGS